MSVATREAWLNAFIAEASHMFEGHGFPLPKNVRASVGFCSTGRKSKRIGECWHSDASADGHFEIFIHPELQGDSARVADVLTHELCHVVTPGDGHGKQFKRIATALGLQGKMTATVAGPDWHAWADDVLATLGPIPAAALQGSAMGRKKQATRLIKAQCKDCGLIFRITGKYLEQCSELTCPDSDCRGELAFG